MLTLRLTPGFRQTFRKSISATLNSRAVLGSHAGDVKLVLGSGLSSAATPPPPTGSPSQLKASSNAAVEEVDRSSLHDRLGAAHELAHEVAAAGNSANPSLSHFEDWMVNIRGEDWLLGPRTDDWFTGLRPEHGVCPGVGADGKIRSLPLPHLGRVTRQATQDYFDNSWTLMETMFAGFHGEEPFYRPPVHGLRHPQIFYYGHTPCLYINKLRVAGVLNEPVNAYFESIFETGVDEMLWDDMHKNDMIWPTVAEVHEYRKDVYKVVSEVIASHPALDDKDGTEPLTIGWDHPMWSMFMGFEHERIHLETSSVLFRETPQKLMQVPSSWPSMHPSSRREQDAKHPVAGTDYPNENRMLDVDGGIVEIGKPRDFPSYGWDNEYGSRVVAVKPFRASEHMITNGEFFEFVIDGGYRTERFWSEDGWGWRKHRNMKWPFFWELNGPQGSFLFRLRNVFETTDMQWDWPVDVNYHEASAYAAWKSEKDGLAGTDAAYRMITEAEHHLIRDETAQVAAAREDPLCDRVMWADGEQFADESIKRGAANLNLAYASQSPVGTFPASNTGHYDTMGNAWEWTEDHFNPLDGFEVHEVYDDFSSPCFDGKHHMIAGGSFVSTGDEASVFARFHFRPHFLQHSGFRLVSSPVGDVPATKLEQQAFGAAPAEEAQDATPVYETSELLDQYLGLHFPTSAETSVPDIIDHAGRPDHALRFPQRIAELLVSMEPVHTNGRALDIGCAVGGSSFTLAKTFDEVVGFDFSHSFVDAANEMRDVGRKNFQIPIEGSVVADAVAVHEAGIDEAVRSRTRFHQGDACALVSDATALGTFDAALLANLLCRLPDPRACLDGLPLVMNPGGVVLMLTPYSWLEQFTHQSNWIGGFADPVTGTHIQAKDVLLKEMSDRGFEKIHEEQVPLVIREHQRKYQYIVSEATAWRRL